ncbi:MAG TPA: response regulator [Planctomycetota bacterium]|nr:response regulator [Planctomycetota bacterium]
MTSTRSILVADDDPLIRQLLSTLLAAGGYRVATAADGGSAVEAAQRERFDLILLDYTLPDLTGFDVLERLREGSAGRSTPVLILSGHRRDTLDSRGDDCGCQGYLEKPVSGRALLSAVRTALAG